MSGIVNGSRGVRRVQSTDGTIDVDNPIGPVVDLSVAGAFASGFASVLAYGAVGDGVTDDRAAIQAAVASGLTVVLPGGRVYLVHGSIRLAAGQLLWAYGATVRRPDQVSATTTSVVVSGVSDAVDVDDATGFVVGDEVTLEDDAVAAYDATPRTIIDIAGNTVTVSSAFGVGSGVGGTLRTTGWQVVVNADGGVRGGMWDGNEAGNPWARWETTGAGLASGVDDATFRDLTIFDSPGEGIQAGSCDGVEVHACVVLNTRGNAIHFGSTAPAFSGTQNARILDCVVQTCNQGTIGHDDGAIVLSNAVVGLSIVGCHVEDTPLAGVGSLDSADSNEISIVDCHFVDCAANAIEGNGSLDDATSDVTVTGCVFRDCGPLSASSNPASATFLRRWVISGNTFQNTRVSFVNVQDCEVAGNAFVHADDATIAVYLENAANCGVENNVIRDGGTGVVLESGCASINVCGNTISDADDVGIYVGASPSGAIVITGNTIRAANVASAYSGIVLEGGATTTQYSLIVQANVVDITASGGTRNGIDVSASTATVRGNTVRGATNKGIWAGGASIIRDNYVEQSAGQAINITGTGVAIIQGNTARRGLAANWAMVVQTVGSLAYVLNNQFLGVFVDLSGGTATLRDNDALAA